MAFQGYPCIKISLDDQLLLDHHFTSDQWTFSIDLDHEPARHVLCIERYGKTNDNWSPDLDQIVEILHVSVDGIHMPNYILDRHSRFEFDNQLHQGSRYFGPNGLWTFEFSTPIITHILDEKIRHESQYNQDYLYPWSYRLGPDSVNNIISNIDQTLEKARHL